MRARKSPQKKTKNTRKHQRNRYISINTAVVEAVTLYLENTPGVHLSDYMFRSASNNGCNENKVQTGAQARDASTSLMSLSTR